MMRWATFGTMKVRSRVVGHEICVLVVAVAVFTVIVALVIGATAVAVRLEWLEV